MFAKNKTQRCASRKQNATMQFEKQNNDVTQRCSRKTKRNDAVREKHNATMQLENKTQRCGSRKTKRNDAVREKQNATMQFARNKTQQRFRETQRDNAVHETLTSYWGYSFKEKEGKGSLTRDSSRTTDHKRLAIGFSRWTYRRG